MILIRDIVILLKEKLFFMTIFDPLFLTEIKQLFLIKQEFILHQNTVIIVWHLVFPTIIFSIFCNFASKYMTYY